jgi:hypothetical protein
MDHQSIERVPTPARVTFAVEMRVALGSFNCESADRIGDMRESLAWRAIADPSITESKSSVGLRDAQ